MMNEIKNIICFALCSFVMLVCREMAEDGMFGSFALCKGTLWGGLGLIICLGKTRASWKAVLAAIVFSAIVIVLRSLA